MVVKNCKVMNIIQIYKKFPTQESCIKHLEAIRWNNTPVCPYCKSTNQTPTKIGNRYHCNTCNTSYSVTVGTIFHKTKMDLQKWFLAISLVLNAKKGYSARQLGRDIEVTKDTAWFVFMRIRKAFVEQGELLEGIVEADETYIGGKNKNRHNDKKTEGGQGRGGSDKTPVIGILQRDGKVKAKKSKDVSGKTLMSFIKQNVKEGSTISTDEWGGYNKVSEKFTHLIVSHGKGEYVKGEAHTNSLEGFWSLFKRGIVGQYHQISAKYLDKYVDEFCFRYNNRKNLDIFNLTIQKSVTIN
jgi:transposase-like protein